MTYLDKSKVPLYFAVVNAKNILEFLAIELLQKIP